VGSTLDEVALKTPIPLRCPSVRFSINRILVIFTL
jgi:hypothetical protein